MSKTAVILAGGRGTRLRPYTVVLPKPLMPIGDYPVLEVIVRQLAYYGFKKIILAVNHQAQLLETYFGDGSKWSVDIAYSLESKPLSTMGPLKLIEDLPENFLVMNGDILTDLDYAKFYDLHVKSKALFTISSTLRETKTEYGVLETNEDNILTDFKEKPILKYNVSMGIYGVNKKVLEYIPDNQAFGFDSLMLSLIKGEKPALVHKYDGYWLDIGRVDDYEEAIDKFDQMKDHFLK